MLSLGGVTAYSQLASAYRLAYPLWFGYLVGGIVLWGVVQHYQRRLVDPPRVRMGHRSQLSVIHDLALPPLPALDSPDTEALTLPPLPSLDR